MYRHYNDEFDAEVAFAQRCFAFDEPLPDHANQAAVLEHIVCGVNSSHGRAVWESWRAQVLQKWLRERPGTRPSCWWRFDSGLREEPLQLPDGREVVRDRNAGRFYTQAAWLHEHKQLTAAERRALPAQALVGEPNVKAVMKGNVDE